MEKTRRKEHTLKTQDKTEQQLTEDFQTVNEVTQDYSLEVGAAFDVNASGMDLFAALTSAGFITFQDGRAVVRFARIEDGGYMIETVAAVNLAGMGERAIKKLEAGLDPAKDARNILKKLLEKTPNITQEQLMEMFQELSKSV